MKAEGARLLQLVRQTLELGVTGQRFEPRLADLPEAFSRPRGVFVTLTDHRGLRGCRGNLQASRPLGEELPRNAWLTAFRDPRFPPVRHAELAGLQIDVSLLSELESIPAEDENVLIDGLVPGHTGLLIEAGPYRATFLPKVWEQLPEPIDFVRALCRKAGFPSTSWPAGTSAWIYEVELVSGPYFAEPDGFGDGIGKEPGAARGGAGVRI